MASAGVPTITVKPPGEFLSSEEFLDWLEPGIHADLIAGEIVMHSPVSFRHADLQNFVDRLLAAYIAEKKLGRLYREVVAVKLGPRHTFLPDLCFFTSEQVKRLEPNYAPFAPTLAVEVVSRDSENRDRRQKSRLTNCSVCRNTGFSIRFGTPINSTRLKAIICAHTASRTTTR